MNDDTIQIMRTEHEFLPDPRRVLAKPFLPGEEIFPDGRSRVRIVLERLLAIPEADVAPAMEKLCGAFAPRHRQLENIFERHFEMVAQRLDDPNALSSQRRLLIGAYFTHEYSIEAAALTNPSIVHAPDQSGVPAGASRFIMSLRAIGEGHISSIEFRSGVVSSDGRIEIEQTTPFVESGQRNLNPSFSKRVVSIKLRDLGVFNELSRRILEPLADRFTLRELLSSIESSRRDDLHPEMTRETITTMHWLATSNYEISFPETSPVCERVIFPAGPTESRGMEDARFVRFVEDDGSIHYYATYTAFNGREVLPQLIETRDFLRFRIRTLNGAGAQNKGMALFPRRIGGRFAMLTRQDRETIHFMTSDDVNFWRTSDRIQSPKRPWELIQIGNCGSPIETEVGWLVLTHGVGPMRQYAIGAMLLDLDDPRRIVASLPEPLIRPDEHERDGYVPNVVYTCGAMAHGGWLITPYGFSDIGVHIATIRLDDLLARLHRHRT